MAYTYNKSDAAMSARKRYIEKAYDRLSVCVPKGSRDKYKAIAEAMGMSLRAFIIEAMDEKAERDLGR